MKWLPLLFLLWSTAAWAQAASLEPTRLPAAERMQTLLHVTQPGRFALEAHSATGTALQLVDMLTGPSAIADGRLDLLLDTGVYKLRAFAPTGATGEVTFSVAPFVDAAPDEAAPVRGQRDASLADLQQRRFWLRVAPGERLRIEAAGRALADLRLWHNGTELAALTPAVHRIEPVSGRPLTDIVLEGNVEPGTYALVAYGGKPLAWANGSAGMPLHLRTGLSEALAGGWLAGQIGPFGSEVYRAGPAESGFRLDLPDPAPAELRVVPEGQAAMAAAITRTQREPAARIILPPESDGERLVQVSGAEGQAFQLQNLSGAGFTHTARPGSDWLSIDAAGLGGDEPPLVYLLTRRTAAGGTERLAGNLPRVGPGMGWRTRFNLRGMLALPFEVTQGGPIAARTAGVAVRADIGPFGASFEPRADGSTPDHFDLSPGYYVLRLVPPPGAGGIIDLTLAPPGLTVASPATPLPLDAALPVGAMGIAPREQLDLYATTAVGARLGLLARPVPVDLFRGPLALTLAAGQAIEVPVRLPGDGAVIATEAGSGPAIVAFTPVPGLTAGRIGSARIAAADHPRTVLLAWQPPAPPPSPVPVPDTPPRGEPLIVGTPRFFDLLAGRQRSFALNVPEGGLYQIETTGRLQTTGRLGTAFIPTLDSGEANGIGRNMRLQDFLRAGAYRLVVGAQNTSGHLGVQARPAAVSFGATLVPGGSVRAAMAEAGGEIFPIRIAQSGTYHLDLLSQTAGLAARLEDAQGWPLREAGDLSSIDQELAAGSYRLLVQPTGVASRVIARLRRLEPPLAHEGHGPFALGFENTAHATWHEPAGREQPRLPDRWTFALAGPAAVKLAISDGMVAELHRAGDAPPARFTHAAGFAATLPAGSYEVTASSLGRNDRLDYTLALTSTELQPDTPRPLTLPAKVPFAIAEERVVSLTSFGPAPLRGVLRNGDGAVRERFSDRGTDWNIGLSRRLPAGTYFLEMDSAVPAKGEPVTAPDALPPDPENNNTDAAPAADATTDADSAPPEIELRLALPPTRPPVIAPPTGSLTLAGGGVHVVQLPPAPDQALLLAAADSTAEVALALERADASGAWHTMATTQGVTAVAGGVGDTTGSTWRALVWTVDGGSEPIRLAARLLQASPLPVEQARTLPIPLEGMAFSLAAAPVSVAGQAPLAVAGGVAGVSVASPGGALAPPEGALILPQSERIWIVTNSRSDELALTRASGAELLALPRAGRAYLSGNEIPAGHIRVWRAASGLGQPGLDAGRGMGIAAGSALALSVGPQVQVFNAGSGAPLRLRASPLDLAELTPRAPDAPLAEMLPPGAALPLRLPEGLHRVEFDLAPGTAAIAGWREPGAVTVWTGDAPVSRAVEGNWTDLLLVNTGTTPAPVGLRWTALDAASALSPGRALKRFYGAAGSFDLPVQGPGRLITAGGSATLIDDHFHTQSGPALNLQGAGRVVITHGPGLLAAWIESADAAPWPAPTPQPITLPQRLTLHDPTMALDFSAPTELLLHVRSTAPVILALGQAPPKLFAQGAELHRVIKAGPARLQVIAPQDGPLTGTMEISAEPVTQSQDGVGAPVALAPGSSAAFGFTVTRAGPVGIGVRAEPDVATARLLRADGTLLGEGVAQLQQLSPGNYVLEASLPPDAPTTLVRPTIVGIAPRPSGPPADVVNMYLALVGKIPVRK